MTQPIAQQFRKVLYKKWIPLAYSESGERIKDTGKWETYFTKAGVFHCWASAFEDGEANFGNFTVALIETPDGTVDSVLPCNLKFVDTVEI